MTHSWFKKVLLSMALVILGINPAFAAETIKIGVIGAHTGDLSSYGLPTLNASRIVAEEINKKGGILGKQIEIIAQDTQCKPELATNAATKLISDGVVAAIGGSCSGATKAALPIFTEAKIVTISSSATTPDIIESGQNPYFFRTIASDSNQGILAANFVINKLKSKKIAILHDKADYGKGFADYAMAQIKKHGIEVVLYEGITSGALDYAAVLNKVRKSKADILIFGGYHPEASKLVQQMKKRRLNIPFISGDGVKDDDFISIAGADSEGAYVTSSKDVSNIAMNAKARALHIEKFGTAPGTFYDNAYAAALALFSAIEKAGTTDTNKLVNTLHTNLVDTPIGIIKFKKSGEAEGIGFAVFQVQDGKFVQIYE